MVGTGLGVVKGGSEPVDVGREVGIAAAQLGELSLEVGDFGGELLVVLLGLAGGGRPAGALLLQMVGTGLGVVKGGSEAVDIGREVGVATAQVGKLGLEVGNLAEEFGIVAPGFLGILPPLLSLSGLPISPRLGLSERKGKAINADFKLSVVGAKVGYLKLQIGNLTQEFGVVFLGVHGGGLPLSAFGFCQFGAGLGVLQSCS